MESFCDWPIGLAIFVNGSNKTLKKNAKSGTDTKTDIATSRLNRPSGPIQWKVKVLMIGAYSSIKRTIYWLQTLLNILYGYFVWPWLNYQLRWPHCTVPTRRGSPNAMVTDPPLTSSPTRQNPLICNFLQCMSVTFEPIIQFKNHFRFRMSSKRSWSVT